MTSPGTNPRPLPITSAPAADKVLPHAYVIWKKSQRCLTCQALHEWSELYAKTNLRSNWGKKYVTNLRPIRDRLDVQYNLPIEIIVWEPATILFCHICHDIESESGGILRNLPLAPQVEIATPPSWAAKGEDEKPPLGGGARKTESTRPRPATIDEL